MNINISAFIRFANIIKTYKMEKCFNNKLNKKDINEQYDKKKDKKGL